MTFETKIICAQCKKILSIGNVWMEYTDEEPDTLNMEIYLCFSCEKESADKMFKKDLETKNIRIECQYCYKPLNVIRLSSDSFRAHRCNHCSIPKPQAGGINCNIEEQNDD